MNNFSIKDIELLSGIKAHTFRIWEQRHGLCFCKRKESLHRYYDNEDLKSVLRIAYLYHRGYKISKIATLSNDEIIRLASGDIADTGFDASVYQLIEASVDYDQQLFEKIIQNSIAHVGFEKTITRVFYPFMQKVGMLWVTEHLIPAQEHFSSSVIQQKILVAINQLGPVSMNQKHRVLIFAPEGEYHEIPLLIALYLFKKHGIGTVYFGVNIPLAYIEYYCANKNISHFYLHLITSFSNRDGSEYPNLLAKKFPGIKILLSGPALHAKERFSSAVKTVNSMDDLIPSM